MADAQLPVPDVKASLLRSNEQFRQLVSEHQALDERIRHLTGSLQLSPQEHFEETALKKQKLALKDRIEAIVRDFNLGSAAH